jgi:hypothetical protein
MQRLENRSNTATPLARGASTELGTILLALAQE